MGRPRVQYTQRVYLHTLQCTVRDEYPRRRERIKQCGKTRSFAGTSGTLTARLPLRSSMVRMSHDHVAIHKTQTSNAVSRAPARGRERWTCVSSSLHHLSVSSGSARARDWRTLGSDSTYWLITIRLLPAAYKIFPHTDSRTHESRSPAAFSLCVPG